MNRGGFAEKLRADWRWVIPLPENIDIESAGPLLCGGITVFKPLLMHHITATSRVGVIGIGGLGHIAIKLLHAMGCEVTAFSSDPAKEQEVLAMGADKVVNSRDPQALKALAGQFGSIINTVNVSLDWQPYFEALTYGGNFHTVGAVLTPLSVPAFTLIAGDRSVSGSATGTPYELRKLMRFAARSKVAPTTELFPMSKINDAIQHVRDGKARYPSGPESRLLIPLPGACRPALKSLWKASRNLLNLAVKSAQPLPILQAGTGGYLMSEPLLIARTPDTELFLLPAMANRHGLITGATGTGKTVTLQKLAESLSEIGVPVFMADVKGDLTGIAQAGTASEKLLTRLKNIGVNDWQPHANPVVVWDIFGEKGHPVRATVSDLGPLLLARLLNLNDVQSGVLNIIFRIADDQGLLLLDFKDLRAITQYIGDNAKSFQNQYGNISSALVRAMQRGLLSLEQQGAAHFFGEPMLDIKDWMRTDANGKGVINILSAEKLYQMPKLYAASLLWMLSELYEQLPEAGDLEKPKLVFFFDEAHLLFNDAPQVLLDKIEQVIRLIRSKGVGVWFVSQNPSDIPDNVLGQLGNRVQHALRAFTPKDQKAVKAAAQTMRANPAFDTEKAIQELGTGEALISFLDAKGETLLWWSVRW